MNNEITLRDGTTTTDPRLDRLQQFDERSRAYPVRALLGDAPRQPRSYTWRCLAALDQRAEGACVGFSWSHELAARPGEVRGITNETARALYRRAQQLDPWPGEEPQYSGTSVLAGVKALLELHPNKYGSYRWAFGLDDVLRTISYLGPVVLGVNWHASMYEPDASGLIRVEGAAIGGHAILANGVNVKKRLVRLMNSWSATWGINGACFIGFGDLEQLLNSGGEACVPVGRAVEKRLRA